MIDDSVCMNYDAIQTIEQGDTIFPVNIIESLLHLDDDNTLNSYKSDPGNIYTGLAPLNPLMSRPTFRVSSWDIIETEWLHSERELPILEKIGQWKQPLRNTLHLGTYHGYTIACLLNRASVYQIESVVIVDATSVRYPMAPISEQKESLDHAKINTNETGVSMDKIFIHKQALDSDEVISSLDEHGPFDLIEIDSRPDKTVIRADLLVAISRIATGGIIIIHDVKKSVVFNAILDFVDDVSDRVIDAIQYIPTFRGLVMIKVKASYLGATNYTLPPVPDDDE